MENKTDRFNLEQNRKYILCRNCGARMIWDEKLNLFKCLLCGNSVRP